MTDQNILMTRKCKCGNIIAPNLLKVERVLNNDSSFRHYEILFELSCVCGSYQLEKVIVG